MRSVLLIAVLFQTLAAFGSTEEKPAKASPQALDYSEKQAAQTTESPKEQEDVGPKSPTVASTLLYLHKANIRGAAMGRLAMKNSTNADLLEFAKTLVSDHERMDKYLEDFQATHELGPKEKIDFTPKTLEEYPVNEGEDINSTEMNRLRLLNDREFDRQFVAAILLNRNQLLAFIERIKGDPKVAVFHASADTLKGPLEKQYANAKRLKLDF